MLFTSTLLTVALLISGSSLASSVGGEVSKELSPGMYKIINPASGTWARNLPGAGHQGPWMSFITMTSQYSSVYQTWEVTASEEGYKIHNSGSRASAFSRGHTGDPVDGFSDGFTKWYIEPAGANQYRIHYPDKDLVWTVNSQDSFPDIVILEPARGGDAQLFTFDEL